MLCRPFQLLLPTSRSVSSGLRFSANRLPALVDSFIPACGHRVTGTGRSATAIEVGAA